MSSRRWLFTGIALIAFASNSVLCRAALGTNSIDPAGFSILRLASGTVALWLLTQGKISKRSTRAKSSFPSAMLLFSYALTFSYAFVRLNAATGALILFSTVQATMFFASVIEGQKPTATELLGLIMAMGGLVYLVFPGINAPPPGAAFLMMLAGISWGIYSLRGRGADDPIFDTRGNFTRTLPLIFLLGWAVYPSLQWSSEGMLLAVISGAIASALGYTIWYTALQDLNAKHAALVQLIVPVLASAGGVMFLSELLTLRLVLGAIFILGGIAMAIAFPDLCKRLKARSIQSEVNK